MHDNESSDKLLINDTHTQTHTDTHRDTHTHTHTHTPFCTVIIHKDNLYLRDYTILFKTKTMQTNWLGGVCSPLLNHHLIQCGDTTCYLVGLIF